MGDLSDREVVLKGIPDQVEYWKSRAEKAETRVAQLEEDKAEMRYQRRRLKKDFKRRQRNAQESFEEHQANRIERTRRVLIRFKKMRSERNELKARLARVREAIELFGCGPCEKKMLAVMAEVSDG